jgi:hypothetical protein
VHSLPGLRNQEEPSKAGVEHRAGERSGEGRSILCGGEFRRAQAQVTCAKSQSRVPMSLQELLGEAGDSPMPRVSSGCFPDEEAPEGG